MFDSRKNARRNKVEGAMDIAKGQIKRAAGVLTAVGGKKAEGRKDQAKGAAKWGKGRQKDLAAGCWLRPRQVGTRTAQEAARLVHVSSPDVEVREIVRGRFVENGGAVDLRSR